MESIAQSFESLKANLIKRMADFEEQQKAAGTPSTAATLAAEFAAFKEFVRESFDCFQKQLHLLASGQDQLEMRGRRKMLLLHGVAEVNEDKNSKTSQVVVAVISKHLGLDDFSEQHIQRCQRLGRSASGDKPRPILVELESYRTRDSVWFSKTKLKGTGITLSEFLTRPRHETFMAARSRFGVSNAYTRDGIIFVIDSATGTRHRIVTIEDLDKVRPAAKEAAPNDGSSFTVIKTTTRPRRAAAALRK